MSDFMNDIKIAVMNNEIEKAEKIALKEIKKNPNDEKLLLKLALIELLFPFEDYEMSLEYINKVLEMSPNYLDALFIKSYLQYFYNYNDIDKTVLDAINNYNYKENQEEEKAISKYIQSWKYRNSDVNLELKYLLESVEICDKLVYPFKRIGLIMKGIGNYKDSIKYLRKAKDNIRIIGNDNDCVDFSEPQLFIDEYIKGTDLSSTNAFDIDKLIIAVANLI